VDKILIIDDDHLFGEMLEAGLPKPEYNICVAKSGDEGLELIKNEKIDLVITDLRMPHLNGLEVLKKIKEYDKNIQVILMTGYGDMHSTIKSMQLGACDYIEKPVDLEKLKSIIRRSLESKKLSQHLEVAISEDVEEYKIENSFVGTTRVMREIFKKIGKVSSSRVTVLIQGPSGTGKELITRIIHYSGVTKDYPFVAVNCTALSETLLESELFGHVKGSFTGAIRDKKGKFELAGEGTIFLDEISEITPNLQVKLLRVIQEKEFERVGGETTLPMRARIVAATNRNLLEAVKEGKFREDLYYRLNIFSIDLPPLKDRKEDIPLLVCHFLKKINNELHKNVRKIPFEVMEFLMNHEWIGNIRELENTLMQAVVLSESDVLEKRNILIRTNNHNSHSKVEKAFTAEMSMAEIEKDHIQLVLNHVNWNKQKACSILGISKPTLNSKINFYQLIPKS
jgi:DNA-binding NtrC family response regulator